MKQRRIISILCMITSAILFTCGVMLLVDPGLNLSNKADHEKEYVNPIIFSGNEDYESNDNLGTTPQDIKNPPVNMLLIGLDQEEVRSDVIILLNFDPTSGKVNLLSVPRDTRVKIRGRFEKINALYALDKEQLLVKGIEQLTGLDIDYYLTLNFKGFRKIIDTLDGVEINVPFDMDYDDPDQNLHIHLKKGNQVLNGTKAEQLVRYRKGNRKSEGYEDGDIGRIKMQQEFVREFFSQKIKIKYLSKADDIFFILRKYMKTNIEVSDIRKYIAEIKKITYDKISMYTVTGYSRYMDELWYFIVDKPATKQLINKNFFK